MPLPDPKKEESKDDFISRCIDSELPNVKEKHPDKSEKKQREIASAICYRHYRKES